MLHSCLDATRDIPTDSQIVLFFRGYQFDMKRTLLLLATLVLLLLVLFSSTHVFIYAQKGNAVAPLAMSGVWREHPYDLLYTVALSSEQQPNGPLIVYRALGADLRNVVPIIAVQREPLNVRAVGACLAVLEGLPRSVAKDARAALIEMLLQSDRRAA